jgi:hypothetical protein
MSRFDRHRSHYRNRCEHNSQLAIGRSGARLKRTFSFKSASLTGRATTLVGGEGGAEVSGMMADARILSR